MVYSIFLGDNKRGEERLRTNLGGEEKTPSEGRKGGTLFKYTWLATPLASLALLRLRRTQLLQRGVTKKPADIDGQTRIQFNSAEIQREEVRVEKSKEKSID